MLLDHKSCSIWTVGAVEEMYEICEETYTIQVSLEYDAEVPTTSP
jgi:hypothetical protein